MKQKDTYGEVKVIETETAIVRVSSPILTPEERQRRLDAIAKSAAQLLLSKNQK